MNTVRSFWLGWGSLCVAGGGAYYFAKREINADRQAKLEAARNKKQAQQELRSGEYASFETNSSSSGAYDNNGAPSRTNTAGSSSQEATQDPSATSHAGVTEADRLKEKSKYQSAVPYATRKGDRFS